MSANKKTAKTMPNYEKKNGANAQAEEKPGNMIAAVGVIATVAALAFAAPAFSNAMEGHESVFNDEEFTAQEALRNDLDIMPRGSHDLLVLAAQYIEKYAA